MTDAVIVNYTQDQINSTICSLDVLYTNLADKLLKYRKYSLGCANVDALKEVFLYRWAIDGQIDYNVLTIEGLNDIVNRIKDIV